MQRHGFVRKAETLNLEHYIHTLIHIGGYNVFRSDRASKGGLWSMLKALWTPPSLNWSANLNPSFYYYQIKSPQRCWPDSSRLLSPTVSLTQGHYFFLWHFTNLSDSVLILLGVLNWHWLSTSSNDICDVVHSNTANTVSDTIKPKTHGQVHSVGHHSNKCTT